MKTNFRAAITIGALAVVIVAAYRIYAAAFGSGLNFDDSPNLVPLEHVHDISTASEFIFSGNAGPFGRPVALATFALQFSAWPHAIEEFTYTNVLIHLINGLLVGWFALRMSRAISDSHLPQEAFAVTVACFWVLQPLLASTSLLIIQRMTSLSTAFMLMGLIGYLAGRARIGRTEVSGWVVMLGSLTVSTILASLTKETGALLPLYVWVLEVTVLRPIDGNRAIRIWRRLLVGPLLILAFYAFWQFPTLLEPTARGYSSGQRLLAEGPILWQYLRLLFLPRAADLGPFHDDIQFPVDADGYVPSVLAWLLVILLAAMSIFCNKRFPWFSFAVGWFLIGHALESTIFALEPYFEHRNYLPSLGPIALVSSLVWRIPGRFRIAANAFVTAYPIVLACVLYQVTAAWGTPAVAATLWANKHEHSERAQQFLANQLIARGNIIDARRLLKAAYESQPRNLGLLFGALQLSCHKDDDVIPELQSALAALSASASLDYSIPDTINTIVELQRENRCRSIPKEWAQRFLRAMHDNPSYQRMPNLRFKLHSIEARIYFDEHNLDLTMYHLEQAFEASPDLDTAVLMIGVLKSAGLMRGALEKLDSYQSFLPDNPVLRRHWQRRLREIRIDLEQNTS